MPIILNPLGSPEPPSEIVRRLQQVDPGLGMLYLDFVTGPRWAITLRWDEFDPRREDIQKGLRDREKDWDAICFLPLDCSPDEAFGYFQRGVRSGTTDRARKMSESAHLYNRLRVDEAFREVHEEALDEIERRGSRLFEGSGGTRVPRVSVPATVGKKKKK